MKVLELVNLSKFKKGNRIFENVCMEALEGQCYGIVGKDDAGKTSLVESIMGLTDYDSGSINFCEKTMKNEERSQIGYVPDDLLGFEKITGVKLIDMLIKMKKKPVDIDYVQELIDFFELDPCQNVEYMDETINKCLYIISVVMWKPKLLILDEPFNFLDTAASEKLCKLINTYKAAGNSVIIVSDNFELIKGVVDRIMYLDEGVQLFYNESAKLFQGKVIVSIKGFDYENIKRMLLVWLKMEPRDDAFLKSVSMSECEDGTLNFILENDVTYIKRFIMSINCDEFTVNKLTFEDMIYNESYKSRENILEEFLK